LTQRIWLGPAVRDKLMRTLIALAIVAAGVVGTASVLAPNEAAALRLYLAGRAGACSVSESLASVRFTRKQVEGERRMKAACKLVEKDPRGFALWDTPQGRFWIPQYDESTLYLNLSEQDREVYRSVPPAGVVLDAGASIGLYTRKALAQGASLVVAIEPSPENLECLRRNLAAEIARGVVLVYPKGVWDKEYWFDFNIDTTTAARNSFVRKFSQDDKTLRLPLTTIDNLVRELQLKRVDFIKMDIEGAERHALSGARETLRKFRPRMALCVHHLEDDPVKIPEIVGSIVPGYRTDRQCLLYTEHIEAEVMHFY